MDDLCKILCTEMFFKRLNALNTSAATDLQDFLWQEARTDFLKI